MVVLIACKNEQDPIKNEGARVFTTLYINFSEAQGQINLESMVVSGRCSNSLKLLCMSSLHTRIQMIELKMKELECSQHFSRRPRAAKSAVFGPIKPNFELVGYVIDVLVTCEDEEDQIKNESTREVSRFPPHY